MRIGVIGDAASVHVRGRTLPLLDRGHDVHWVSENDGALPANRLLRPAGPSALARLADHRRKVTRLACDVLHIHYAASLGAWLAVACGRREPMMVSVMGGDVLDREQMVLPAAARWMTAQVLRRADLVTAKTEHLAAAAIALGARAERVRVARWGIDTALFRPVSGEALRAELGLAAGDRVILSPRSCKPFYNIHLAVEALPAILAAEPRARLVLTEHDADPAYRDALNRRAAELAVDGAIVWAGVVPQSRMAELYALSEVALSLPASDGFPQSVMEGLACHTPCVVSDLDRLRELLEDGESALFCRLDPERVARAVIAVLADPSRAERLRKGGHEVVRRVGTLALALDGLEADYAALAARGTSAAVPLTVRLAMSAVLGAWALRCDAMPARRGG